MDTKEARVGFWGSTFGDEPERSVGGEDDGAVPKGERGASQQVAVAVTGVEFEGPGSDRLVILGEVEQPGEDLTNTKKP